MGNIEQFTSKQVLSDLLLLAHLLNCMRLGQGCHSLLLEEVS
jgi:hypothetical protein